MDLADQKLKFDHDNAENNKNYTFNIAETEKRVFGNKEQQEDYNAQLVHANSELTNTNTVLTSEKDLLKNELKLSEKNLSDSRAAICELDHELSKEISEKESLQTDNHGLKQSEIDYHHKIDALIRQKNELVNACEHISKENKQLSDSLEVTQRNL